MAVLYTNAVPSGITMPSLWRIHREIGYQWISTSAHARRKMLADVGWKVWQESNFIKISSNAIQHCPTCPNMVFKCRQHVVANNVGWCCPNMLHLFKWALNLHHCMVMIQPFFKHLLAWAQLQAKEAITWFYCIIMDFYSYCFLIG